MTEAVGDGKTGWVEVETNDEGTRKYEKIEPKLELTCKGTVFWDKIDFSAVF